MMSIHSIHSCEQNYRESVSRGGVYREGVTRVTKNKKKLKDGRTRIFSMVKEKSSLFPRRSCRVISGMAEWRG